jgi:dynein heavy chain
MAVENVSKVSKAATSLCLWCHAMDVYSKVAKEMGPKKEKLIEINSSK